jgi:hypothetical protein
MYGTSGQIGRRRVWLSFFLILIRRLSETEIEEKITLLRSKLTNEDPIGQDVKRYVSRRKGHRFLINRLKPHQVHDLAAAKEQEMEKIRRAFGIRDNYVEGDAFKQMKERTAKTEP